MLKIKKITITLITIIVVIVVITTILSGCQEQEKTENIKENNNLYEETKTLYVGYSNSSYYKTIQDALDNSIDGDTIIIENGTYNEILNINSSIKLIGENKESTIIHYITNDKNSQVVIINVNANHCIIGNLTVSVSMNDTIAKGIYVKGSDTLIENNIISGIVEGIYLARNSENNSIINSKIINGSYGIYSLQSINNIISNNIFLSNALYGIYFSNSDYNIISNNIFSYNNYAIRIKGSNYNKVFENCIRNNDKGAYCCCGAYYNMFYSNIFGNNFHYNAKESASLINFWYDYETNVGNYWDEYDGIDENKDGFGDTPLIILDTKDEDLYPLMEPPSNVSCN